MPSDVEEIVPSVDYNDMPPKPWEAAFLVAYRLNPTLVKACQAAGITRATVWRWRVKCPRFKAAMEDAKQDGIDEIQAALIDRALTRDTNAAMFLLKNLRPDEFGDRPRGGSGAGNAPMTFTLNIGGPVGDLKEQEKVVSKLIEAPKQTEPS